MTVINMKGKLMEDEEQLRPTPEAKYTPHGYMEIMRTLATRIYHREKSCQQEALRMLEVLNLLEREIDQRR